MKTIILFAICSQIVLSPISSADDLDSDRDGLSDYQENHKYLTNPQKKDSDDDGVPDSDWHERREYTYTIRTVVKVIRPVNTKAINDNYQDARVLSEKQNHIELEVIHYPYADIPVPIKGSRNWKKVTPVLREYVKPSPATNWDDQMRKDLLAAMKADGIMVDKLTDKQVVERASSWLICRSRSLNKVFTTYYVHFPNSQPRIYPGLEGAFEHEFNRDKDNYDWTLDQHFDYELLGKGMFYNKTHGSCTSLAVYLTTVLRALGIPTRMVIVIPAIDVNDKDQLKMVEKGISHHKIRKTLLGAFGSQHGFVAHTFNEVYIEGRWHRLDSNQLGANILSSGMGLKTHVHTFSDLSEADLAATWGLRYGKGSRDAIFRTSNPYCTTEISDRFGLYCDMPNPDVKKLRNVTITKAYWFFSGERPGWIKKETVRRDKNGHILAHVDVPFDELKLIYPKLDKDFILSAKGYPTLRARAERGYWNSECYIRIPEKEMNKMARGVPYRLAPANPDQEYKWIVGKNVYITR
ncbi:transglutaminase domain-containing protein [Planctomycetota bacterium]